MKIIIVKIGHVKGFPSSVFQLVPTYIALAFLLYDLLRLFRDVSTASGRPSRRDQLSSTEAAGGGRGRGQTSRSYAGSPTQQYPPPGGPLGRGNVPSSISSSAFTVGTSKYNTARYV